MSRVIKQLLHVKRLPCRGVQVINHGSSQSSRIARQNLLNIVILRTIQRLWRRSDGKKINYNAETGKLRHYLRHKCRDEMWRCWTVAHNCHGKTKNLTAKTKYLTAKPKTSGQKQNTSRQNQNPHCKTKDLTVKPNTSQQNFWLVKSIVKFSR